MKIDVNFKNTNRFGDLRGGDTFWYELSGTLWMKLIITYDGDNVETIYNAVALDDGTLSEFGDNEVIIPIKTKVINAEEVNDED